MRKIICAALTASLLLALMPSAATANRHRRPPPQEVEGSILMPAPWTDDSGCFAGLHRRLLLLMGDNNQGWFGYHFEVEEHTWNRNFVLELTGGSGDYVDLDIYFYLDDFGGPDNFINDPVNASPPPSQSFNTREEGGEAGKVPEGAEHVIVCLYGGDRGFGYNVDFEYRAGRGVRLPRD